MKNLQARSVIMALLAMLSLPLHAGEGKANFSLVSDYIFRGESASNNKFVVQGGYEYDYGNSLLVGGWVSTLPSNFEYDIYARYSDELGDFGYSAGFIYYGYSKIPVTPAEVNLALSYYNFMIMGSTSAEGSYTEAAYKAAFDEVSIGLHMGLAGQDPDYSVRLSKMISGMDIALVYAGKQDKLASTTSYVYALTLSKDF